MNILLYLEEEYKLELKMDDIHLSGTHTRSYFVALPANAADIMIEEGRIECINNNTEEAQSQIFDVVKYEDLRTDGIIQTGVEIYLYFNLPIEYLAFTLRAQGQHRQTRCSHQGLR